jgi:hypothetical protein
VTDASGPFATVPVCPAAGTAAANTTASARPQKVKDDFFIGKTSRLP